MTTELVKGKDWYITFRLIAQVAVVELANIASEMEGAKFALVVV